MGKNTENMKKNMEEEIWKGKLRPDNEKAWILSLQTDLMLDIIIIWF